MRGPQVDNTITAKAVMTERTIFIEASFVFQLDRYVLVLNGAAKSLFPHAHESRSATDQERNQMAA
jgi:hypothetical protein